MSQKENQNVDKTLNDLHDYRRNAQRAILAVTQLHQQNQKDTDEWQVAKADLHTATVNYYLMLKPYLIESGDYLDEDEYIAELSDGSKFRVNQIDTFILDEVEKETEEKKPGESTKVKVENKPKTLPVSLAKASIDYLNQKMVQYTSQTDVSKKSQKKMSEDDIEYDEYEDDETETKEDVEE